MEKTIDDGKNTKHVDDDDNDLSQHDSIVRAHRGARSALEIYNIQLNREQTLA